MYYFTGEYECKIDAKGRLVLPAKLKAALPESTGNRIVIKRGFEQCLNIYTQTEWDKIFKKVVSLNEFSREHRAFQRSFLRGNTEIELDKTGRFLLPRSMIKYSGLEKDALLVGIGNRIELWNPDIYDEFLANDEEMTSALAEKFLGDWENSEKENDEVELEVEIEAESLSNANEPSAQNRENEDDEIDL